MQVMDDRGSSSRDLCEPARAEYCAHDGVRLMPPSGAGDVWLHIGVAGASTIAYCTIDGSGEPAPDCTVLTAVDAAQERRNLEDFVDRICARLDHRPDMHVYHYGARADLCALVQHHGVGEEVVDEWLREDRLVDLRTVLERSFRVGGSAGVDGPQACEDVLRLDRWLRPYAESLRVLEAFDDDWEQPLERGHPTPFYDDIEQSEVGAVVHAAANYFWREDMARRWQHLAWLDAPQRDWGADYDVLVVHGGSAGPWVPKRVNYHRTSQLHLVHAGVAEYEPGAAVRLVYDSRSPGMAGSARGRGWTEAVVVSHRGNRLEVRQEIHPMSCEPPQGLPVAVLPSPTVRTTTLMEPVRSLAWDWADCLPGGPSGAVPDLLRRHPPRLVGGERLPRTGDERADIEQAVRNLDNSYLAVEGPAGSGKTRIAASVATSLVRSGWRVGVVSQSHRAVENVLDEAVEHGLEPDRVAKEPKRGAPASRPYHRAKPETWLTGRSGGALVGGTAWQFRRSGMLQNLPLDLLVVDEAGSFPLGLAMPLWDVADRLLLLGDAQQLPPVAHGVHPAPVEASVLSWLLDGRTDLPEQLGYRLPATRRMRVEVAQVVAGLAYPDGLPVHPATNGWELQGVTPGVHPIRMRHTCRAVHSPEEVRAVVDLVASHVGRRWSGEGAPRALAEADVMVVAAYHAQAEAIREALAEAGFHNVPVGLVDRFQGREAVVVIMSLAASSAAGAPRGPGFLLSRNRLTTALSRAQWAAYIVHGRGLLEHPSPTAVERDALDAFGSVVA